MILINHRKKVLIAATIIVAVWVVAWLVRSQRDGPPAETSTTQARKVRFYQDSMHPWVKSDRPGKCTVCAMELTPIYDAPSTPEATGNVVVLNPNSITVLNVQTEEVKAQGVTRTLQVAGSLEADENRKTIVAAPAAGRIDDLTVRFPGIEVKEGERLVTFYSPELTLEKRRFLVRARMSVQKDPTGGMAKPMSDSDPYYSDLISPQAGTVVERNVYKGQYVTDGERLFTIVDLSTLWFRFDVYEQQLPWLRLGQTVELTVAAVPGKVFPAVITFIEPMLNEATRTVKVRADIKNPLMEMDGRQQRLLSLGMYAQGEVRAELRTTVAVPRSAILQPGSAAYVYVEQSPGSFERRRILVGHQGDSLVEVTQGLEAGERVVVAGNVLLDAQAQFSHIARPELLDSEVPNMAGSGNRSRPQLADTRPLEMSPGPPPAVHEVAERTVEPEKEIAPEPGPILHAATTQPATEMTPAKPRFNPRNPEHPTGSSAHPGYRNNRLGKYDAAFDAAFNRMAELRTSEITEANRNPPPAPSKLTELQSRHLGAVMAAASQISGDLAADNLERFKSHSAELVDLLSPLEKELSSSPMLSGMVLRLQQANCGSSAKDLTEARGRFLPLGAATAKLAQELIEHEARFAKLKVYHCPMAPEPGLWAQTGGPLANPFFGAKMQHCGEEVELSTDSDNARVAKLNHAQPAP